MAQEKIQQFIDDYSKKISPADVKRINQRKSKLVRPTLLQEILAGEVEQAAIPWDKVSIEFDKLKIKESARTEHLLPGLLFEIHLSLLLLRITQDYPQVTATPVINGKVEGVYKYILSRRTGSIAVAAKGGNSYAEYDNVVTLQDGDKLVPVVFEANHNLQPQTMSGQKLLSTPIIPYRYDPIFEYFRTTTLSLVILTTKNDNLRKSSKIWKFINHGGIVVSIPYTNDQYMDAVRATGLLRDNK